MLSSNVRTIVVGAGPVGLMCALQLAKSGVPVLLLEQNAAPPRDLRASTFHPPTLEMLDADGVTPELIAQGRITPTWQVRMHATGEYAEFDLGVLAGETPHPYRLQCEQWKLSDALLARIQVQDGIESWFDTRVTGLRQDADHVTIIAERAGETIELGARYVIGADGARSTVREAVGIGFAGETYPETTMLVTTDFEFAAHLPHLSGVNYCWAEHGTFSLLRLPDVWRCSFYPREGESIDQAIADDAIEWHLQHVVTRPERYHVLEKRPYRIHQRVADRYRAWRVLLAGDAAHLNSPSGGMGMNGGVHDAVNLAETLAAVWNGADAALLDRYERQRRPVAIEQIIQQAERNRSRMRERDPARRRELLANLQRTAADPALALPYLLKSSMIEGLRLAASVE